MLTYYSESPSFHSGWYANPNSVFSSEMLPQYQAQTTALKNSVSNAVRRSLRREGACQ